MSPYAKAAATVVLMELAALTLGTGLLCWQYGWKTGIGLGLLAYVAMPVKQ